MRRLSRQLKRSAMAAYWYVSDKRELLDLVAGKLLSRVELPDPDSGPWDQRLRAVIDGIDAQLHSHPGIATILLERMRSTDRRLMNGILEILLSAGFEGPEVFLSYAMIHTYLFGRYQVVEFEDDLDPPDLEDTIRELRPYLAGLHGRDFFNYGIDTIIDGLRARLAAPRKVAPRGKPKAVRTRK
jgi:AcrR family transcriptional regulator